MTDKVERIELKSKQIPSTAQSVLCGALADGAWSNLKAISLIGHQLLESTADDRGVDSSGQTPK